MDKPLSVAENAFCEWWESVRHEDIEGGYEKDVALDAWRVAYQFAEKQARAEVLAPIKALVDKQAEDEGLWYRAQTAAEGYVQQELRRLHAVIELQPAAKALEELLREERLEELRRLLSVCVGLDEAVVDLRPEIELRIAELEKARAEGKG